ncbi:MAG TPA: response regulator [Caulobacteraceae bacterium]|nr:response regulator [Caulobacteraceae bacterium]
MPPKAFNRFDPVLYGVTAVMLIGVFLVDLGTPLGTAEWVIYVVPCALAYLTWRPWAPVLLALAATLLIATGYFLSPTGMTPEVAGVNRAIGVAVIWVIAATGFFFIQNKRAVRREEWLQSGQVGLTEAMSGEHTVAELGQNILRFLADYVETPAAALYVRDGEGFARCATVGVPAEGGVPETIGPNDGLVGRAAREGRIVVIEAPDGYLYFGSSFGRAQPRHLLIAPASADGAVNAVVELGFQSEVSEQTRTLLDRVSSAVGIAVRSAFYRTRLQELLEETQQQAEELQVQSEELRTTNDELEQQSRSLQDSQAKLELQQTELEQTNAHLEEQTQLLEAQRDDLSAAQGALQRQTRELEQASRYKSEFLANMSHELRTPLNSLLIMARLLSDNREENLSDEQVRFAETIESAGNDLLSLINDILDISKIEAGHLDLRPASIRIATLIKKVKSGVLPLAREKGLDLRVETAADAPGVIETDPQRLEQILKNLLSNAVKFTETGEVVLTVGKAGPGKVAFGVRDTGIGIAPEQQQMIFEPFRQAEGGIDRKQGGTGLGLSISRELAHLLGGEIHLESAVGAGSLFTLTLPEALEAAQAVRPATSEVQSGSGSGADGIGATSARRVAKAAAVRRAAEIEDDRDRLTGDSRVILIVEDDPAFARILCDLAHEQGFQCLVASTADEGVIAARQYLPQAVILDIGLPDHSGMTVLDRIKRDAHTRHIPVHVVSVSDYTQTALSFGAVSYMLKPVKREELAVALEKLEAGITRRVRRVLIVEDDETQLESLQQLLRSEGVDTVGARKAADTLQRLKDETFDCMVLDLTLPDASGLELLEQISEDDAFAFPPVIVYTGRDLSADEELRLRKYSRSIIIKGAKSPERLLDEVTLFLHQVVSELPERQQRLLAKSLNRDATLEGRRVLVVEDDIRNVFVLSRLLEQHGIVIQVARNGREALQALEEAEGTPTQVDLVLMDLMMPEMDGLTATRAIRSRAEWAKLPIIAVTAKAMADDQEQCLAAGANDYLAKPLDVDKLLSLVRVWMPR